MNTFLLPHAFGPSSLGTDRLQSLSYPRAGSDRVVVGRQPNGVELSCPMGLACDGEHVFVAESGSSCVQNNHQIIAGYSVINH